MGVDLKVEAKPPEHDGTTSTLLLSLWTFSTFLWSIFTEPHKTIAVRTLLFQPLWIFRMWKSDLTWRQDLGLFLALHNMYGLWWTRSWTLPSIQGLIRIDWNNRETQIYFGIFALLAICGAAAGSIVFREQQLQSRPSSHALRSQRIDEALLPPSIIPSRTTHSRMFPKKHSFSYSYLFVGVPVEFTGRIGSVLSVDSAKAGWFDVRAADYLHRSGEDQHTLSEKLRRFLHTKGVTSRDYAFAYLVTAPRLLSYSFNPASFYYIYDSYASLKYMVIEVNNTFDERRLYLLRSDASAKTEGDDVEKRTTKLFTDSWEKDFHVSPFNSRKGSYSLRAIDPLAAYEETGHITIDNTIVLKSSKEHAKIVARVFSEGNPEDPEKITSWQLTKFIAVWWWVGLATFPRIVWEAAKLFFRRKLHVWFRPEVVGTTSIGRAYTSEEKALEQIFRDFLTQSVEHADRPLRVIYEPAHYDDEEIVLYSTNFTYKEDHDSTLTLKVISPAFYSRFLHYAHAKEAFDRECLFTDEKNRTVTIDGTPALPDLLHAMKHASQFTTEDTPRIGFLENIRWKLLRRLRCPAPAAAYPESLRKSTDEEYTISDIRSFHFSEMDQYVRQSTHIAQYRRIVLKIFLAERFAMGIPGLIALWDITLRSCLILVSMWYCDNSAVWDILRARPFHREDFWISGFALLLANSVHFWSLIKG
ncbi:hypothetical protein CB0940_07644 [Cercospora beticola]|uniref:Uncharacterized protein n=2 Tax=Cercospora beticola TaxID=122368 RepID=A0A2G5HAT0_CERBT|nr:hypothetical protein CB0940_07644 [Cercospora beticola]PIA89645.1 hypothetical protein CB0940_07644 [Cercospora beticola]